MWSDLCKQSAVFPAEEGYFVRKKIYFDEVNSHSFFDDQDYDSHDFYPNAFEKIQIWRNDDYVAL